MQLWKSGLNYVSDIFVPDTMLNGEVNRVKFLRTGSGWLKCSVTSDNISYYLSVMTDILPDYFMYD